MPTIYLSPSTQEWNRYPDGQSEEYYMNRIADAMVPYLRANAIRFVRNTPQMTAASSIQASNAGNYDLHLALHSNASPPSLSGRLQGPDVYYSEHSPQSRRAAGIIADNLKVIYPDPNLVSILPTATLGEVTRTRAPSVLVEIAYHDNAEDAVWITENIEEIAYNLSLSLTEYFGLPFLQPLPPRIGIVTVANGRLNLRERPSVSSAVVGRLENGQKVTVWGEWNGWYAVESGPLTGFLSGQFLRF